jgi:hypothetical protein
VPSPRLSLTLCAEGPCRPGETGEPFVAFPLAVAEAEHDELVAGRELLRLRAAELGSASEQLRLSIAAVRRRERTHRSRLVRRPNP